MVTMDEFRSENTDRISEFLPGTEYATSADHKSDQLVSTGFLERATGHGTDIRNLGFRPPFERGDTEMAEPTTCDLLFDAGQLRARPSRSANRSAINERVSQGNSSQFNSLDFYSCGSGPGGRWFKSTRPDQSFWVQPVLSQLAENSAWTGPK